MLTRIISSADGFRQFSLTRDDELDAAVALAGYVNLPKGYRYCFQTTYLNERYHEYQTLLPDQRLIWVLRNPYSVIYSMAYHWRASALRRLYDSCISDEPDLERFREHREWSFRLARTEKACIAYRWKTEQILKIKSSSRDDQLMIVDYDELIQRKEVSFPRIFQFIEERYQSAYTELIRSDSLRKAEQLSAKERRLTESIAMPAYRKCCHLIAQQ